jgi:hypothetical protein
MLWEGLVLVCVIAAGLGVVMLRRKMSGRPAFSNEDRILLFNTPLAAASLSRLCLRFSLAVLLFCCIGLLEIIVFAPFGAAILSVSLLLSCASIVNIILL